MKLKVYSFTVGLIIIFNTLTAIAQPQTTNVTTDDCSSQLKEVQEKLTKAETKLKDWPNLERYREANSKLPVPTKNENRVVFMGDSITDMWDDPDKSDGFFPGKPYVNRGIGGQTTPQMLIRFRPDVIDLKPKAVVILAGTNDIAGHTGPATLESIQNNLSSMAELANAHGILVIMASLLPVSDYEKKADGTQIIQTTRRPPAQIVELNKWIKDYTNKNGYVYLDYYSAMVDNKGMLKDELSYDGLHADAKGYSVMAPLAEEAIKLALKKKR
jgi:lysophospholipase L1-like esterase